MSLKRYLAEVTKYVQECGVDVYPYPSVKLINTPQQGDPLYITTGYYDPANSAITLFTDGRHMKDILRSYVHELIHHNQYLSGEMTPDKMGEGGDPKYAQNNPHMRKLEEDAYKRGNMLFRDWTDNKKYK